MNTEYNFGVDSTLLQETFKQCWAHRHRPFGPATIHIHGMCFYSLVRISVSDAPRPYDLALTFASEYGCRLPAPGHKFVDAGLGPSVDEVGQQIGEVGLWVDVVQLAGFDQ
jgi:hypothetical protein